MINVLKKAAKKLLGTEIASRTSDPNFYGALQFLSYPDTILHKMGKSQEVFCAIIAGAHVIGLTVFVGVGKADYRRCH
jgi:hypothetical protein